MSETRRTVGNRVYGLIIGSNGLLAEQNRGRLLDLTVFAVNVGLMWLLTPIFLRTLKLASAEDPIALAAVFLLLLALLVLSPLAAISKRPGFHRRKRGRRTEDGENDALGCLFHPVFYFCLQIVVVCAIHAFIINYVLGLDDPGPEIFLGILSVLVGFAIASTVFVSRYFTPPRKEPRTEFFRSHTAELLGDVFVFANMFIFQLIWNLLTTAEMFSRVTGVGEFVGRLMFLTFLALLIYFPPRIFYLAEDAGRPGTWLTILLANSPVIFDVVVGGNSG